MSVNNLGVLRKAKGDLAVEPLSRALASFRRTLGDDHPDTLISVTASDLRRAKGDLAGEALYRALCGRRHTGMIIPPSSAPANPHLPVSCQGRPGGCGATA